MGLRTPQTMPSIAHLVTRKLAPAELDGPLFRYPGPCGLALWFAGRLERLGPGDLLWLSADPAIDDAFGARFFGTLALPHPRAFAPGAAGDGIYVARNRRLRPSDEVSWVAPPGQDRAGAIDALCRYLEELDGMRRSGAPGPGVPWCRVPAAERRRLLALHDVTPVWTDGERAPTLCYNPGP